jgi:ACS family D-galactonate transporter-like MFS transporter
MMNTGFGLAGMVSPVVFGAIIERTGRYDLPFFLSGALLLVGAVASVFIDPTKRIPDPSGEPRKTIGARTFA